MHTTCGLHACERTVAKALCTLATSAAGTLTGAVGSGGDAEKVGGGDRADGGGSADGQVAGAPPHATRKPICSCESWVSCKQRDMVNGQSYSVTQPFRPHREERLKAGAVTEARVESRLRSCTFSTRKKHSCCQSCATGSFGAPASALVPAHRSTRQKKMTHGTRPAAAATNRHKARLWRLCKPGAANSSRARPVSAHLVLAHSLALHALQERFAAARVRTASATTSAAGTAARRSLCAIPASIPDDLRRAVTGARTLAATQHPVPHARARQFVWRGARLRGAALRSNRGRRTVAAEGQSAPEEANRHARLRHACRCR